MCNVKVKQTIEHAHDHYHPFFSLPSFPSFFWDALIKELLPFLATNYSLARESLEQIKGLLEYAVQVSGQRAVVTRSCTEPGLLVPMAPQPLQPLPPLPELLSTLR